MITVQVQDSNGNPVTTGVNVGLATTSTTGTFWSNSGGTTKITSITIPSGSSSASFYYSDTASGAPTLTASSGSLTPATAIITISGNKLVFTTGETQTLAPGQISTDIQISQETPTGGADYNILGTHNDPLSSSSPTGKFVDSSAHKYIQSLSWNKLPFRHLLLPRFNSRNTHTHRIRRGFTSGNHDRSIFTRSNFSGLKVTASGGGNIGTQTANTPFTITVTAIDLNGNTYTGYAGTNA